MNTLGIYVQVPFCQTRCTYCNFHTGVVSAERFRPYATAIGKEIQNLSGFYAAAGITIPKELPDSTVDTIYIGGGTPSLLEPNDLKSILLSIAAQFRQDWQEVTLEADPETINEEKVAAWMEAGINRISMGVQSFADIEMSSAGRMHRRADTYRAFELLRRAGIPSISADLIAGLPHQTASSWKSSLDELIALQPEHVSVYLLEVDEGSRLGKEILSGGNRYGAGNVPSDDEMADFYELAREMLAEAGFAHYEISNWGRPGKESKHNLKYWRREPYLGFGAGAHSFSGRQRWANAHDAAAYVHSLHAGKLPVEQLEEISPDKALEEELFLGLRQLSGIDLKNIERKYETPIASRFETLSKAGFVKRQGDVVRLAPEKLSVSSEVFVELLK